jgi:hypothetical protein
LAWLGGLENCGPRKGNIRKESRVCWRRHKPKRLTPFFSDVDMETINNGMITIDLIHHGTSEKTGAFQLSLKQAQE